MPINGPAGQMVRQYVLVSLTEECEHTSERLESERLELDLDLLFCPLAGAATRALRAAIFLVRATAALLLAGATVRRAAFVRK